MATGTDTAAGRSELSGIGLAAAGYALFALQDAAVKWLVVDYTVWQILFFRSVMVTAAGALILRRDGFLALVRGPDAGAYLLRAGIMLVAWLSYFGAARRLKLAELVTLYHAAPVFVTVLSILLLKERVGLARWAAVAIGFAGVAVAADPTGRPSPGPALMVLLAAFLWALASILIRRIMARAGGVGGTTGLVIATNAAFLVACALPMPWLWRTPAPADLALMVGLGALGAIGQYLVYEGFRRASASAIAPTEYSGIIWGFLLGFAIWGDLPGPPVFAGAGLILLASLVLVISERRRT